MAETLVQVSTNNLSEVSEQQLFDFVATKLLEQGRKSMTDGGSCKYRGPKGSKCAAGWLIPDEEYQGGYEGEAWGYLVDTHVFPITHAALIQALQYAHDKTIQGDFDRHIRGLLREVAEKFRLDPKILEKKT